MAYKVKKTEHSGSKKGAGAYYGTKQDAKQESARARRRAGRKSAEAPLDYEDIPLQPSGKDGDLPPPST